MNGLILTVLGICTAAVIAVYLMIYESNAMITKIVIVCIAASMAIYWIVCERNTRKRKIRELHRDDYLFAKENGLPPQIDWNEINNFLSDSEYGVNMPMEKWFMLDWAKQPCVEDGIKEGRFSMKGFQVLQALSNDMKHLYDDVKFYYDHGDTEDRNSKYEAVKKVLDTKYASLSEEVQKRIYDQFVMIYERQSKYSTKEKSKRRRHLRRLTLEWRQNENHSNRRSRRPHRKNHHRADQKESQRLGAICHRHQQHRHIRHAESRR